VLALLLSCSFAQDSPSMFVVFRAIFQSRDPKFLL
jgi:hypothetical protein